jgi:hypothetical protein
VDGADPNGAGYREGNEPFGFAHAAAAVAALLELQPIKGQTLDSLVDVIRQQNNVLTRRPVLTKGQLAFFRRNR